MRTASSTVNVLYDHLYCAYLSEALMCLVNVGSSVTITAATGHSWFWSFQPGFLVEITESSWLLFTYLFQVWCLYTSLLIRLLEWQSVLLYSLLFKMVALSCFSFLFFGLVAGSFWLLSSLCRFLMYLWLWRWQFKPPLRRRFTLCLELRLWAYPAWVVAWMLWGFL